MITKHTSNKYQVTWASQQMFFVWGQFFQVKTAGDWFFSQRGGAEGSGNGNERWTVDRHVGGRGCKRKKVVCHTCFRSREQANST